MVAGEVEPDHVLFAGEDEYGDYDAPASRSTAARPVPDTAPDEAATPPPPNLPASFWDELPELAQIRDAAHSTARSADAVLGAMLARVSAITPPTLRGPSPVGMPSTFDVCVAIVGSTGTGKSSAGDVAAALLPINDAQILEASLGSGEGLEESYFGMVIEPDENGKNQKVKRQVRRAFLATLDEGQALVEMGSRKGSTLLPTIRSAWSGQRLGKQNASGETTRQLAPASYRLALLAGFQTELATALLDDASGGTPQRFVYFAAADPSIPDIAPPWPGPFNIQLPRHQAGEQVDLAGEVTAEIRGRSLARSRGDIVIDTLDSHRDLSRLKIAGLFAVMAGRKNITADDWRRSGDVLDASDRTRQRIVDAAQYRAFASARTRSAGVASQAAYLDDSASERALASMAKAIARHVHKGVCEGACRRRCVSRSTSGKQRQIVTLDEALDVAAARGWIVIEADAITPGAGVP